jgi:hypothetical protein
MARLLARYALTRESMALGSMMTAVVATANRMAATPMAKASNMGDRSGACDGRMIEVFLMAAVVMVFFPGMVVVEIRMIDRTAPSWSAPGIRSVSAGRVIRIAVVVPAPAVKASAAEAGS